MNNAFELIPLTIEARGEVITSNVDEVREMVRAALSNINRDLNTDEEFGQAELDVKALKGQEERFTSAKEKALKDAEALHELFAAIDATVEEIRKPRLELEKLIAKRKEEVKSELIEEALGTFDIDPKDARKHFLAGLQTAIKGKRTVESIRTALRVYATNQQAIIAANRTEIAEFEAGYGCDMTMDRRELELKSKDYVIGELQRRFEGKKANDERKRLEAEAAKAKAEAQAAIREAEAAKQPVKPAPLPTPPKIGSIPVGSDAKQPDPQSVQAEVQNEAAEWSEFRAAVFSAFATLKAARMAIKHPRNVQRAHYFANAVNEAWQDVNETEVAK